MKKRLFILLFFLSLPIICMFSQKDYFADSLNSILPELSEHNQVDALKKLMNYYYIQGDDNQAESSANKALEISLKIESTNDVADIYLFMGKLYKGSSKELEYLNKSYKLADENKYIQCKAMSLNLMADYYLNDFPDSSKIFAQKALDLADDYGLPEIQAKSYDIFGLIEYFNGNYTSALENWKHCLDLYNKTNSLENSARISSNIGAIYRRWSEFITAIEYNQEALEAYQKLDDKLGIARCLANIGNVYFDYGIDLNKTIDYYQQALVHFNQLADTQMVAQIKFNLSFTFYEKQDYDQALNYTNESLELYRILNFTRGIGEAYHQLGNVYLKLNDYNASIQNFNKALDINNSQNDELNLVYIQQGLGEAYLGSGDCQQSLIHFESGLNIATKLNLKSDILSFYQYLIKSYKCLGQPNKALKYYESYSSLKDTIFREDYLRQVQDIQTKWETELKTKEKENEILKLNSDIKRQKIITFFVVLIVLVFIAFISILFKQFKALQRVNNLLHVQNEEIRKQRDQISEQAEEIKSSIQYASTIQKASLPPRTMFESYFEEYFIFFRPRDIVSGDFYWCSEVNGKIIITAADCTGHGVPGAFMSMLGMSLLNEIVSRLEILDPGMILDKMKENIIKALHQHGEANSIHDGMDMALCVIDKEKMELQYAGAYNPLVLVNNEGANVYKATKMPVSYYDRKNIFFETITIPISKGDCIYLFSDGYPDQFGGETRKKFMTKKFHALLGELHPLSMCEQKDRLDQEFDNWKGEGEQVDDVLVLGLKF